MNLREINTDKAVVIEIEGRLDTTNYGQLEKKIIERIDAGHFNILCDCEKMDYVSSSGLRIFLMALKKINALKGKFVLCGLQENIREIFEISGFTSIFSIYDTQADALENGF
ncbi:MAG: STAS domain-containing protein [Bacteroidales bacterium]